MSIIGGKWKPLIVYHLTKKTRRTSELKQMIQGITQKMLIQQLRELEADGIVSRKIYNQVPPKVEYSVTKLGMLMAPILTSMCEWGETYLEDTFEQSDYQILNKYE
ncbi:winged helix-turn-helix transcriptional regulator [Brevibacillus reuszeri]|nr:winged helix-turn-helix transcriptional regulator [Brevibacillus reuszeri]MED1857376.1 winged helix-turn-helix transcriptional regulator [Brevibacillus reuszeri]